MVQTIKKIQLSYKNFRLRCQLLSSSLLIEVNDPQENQYYYLVITNDSLPEEIKILFENYQEIYEYLTDLSIPERFQIEEAKVLRLLVKVGKNVKKIPIYLIAKQMTKEMILEKKVQTLQQENHQLRQELKMYRQSNSSLQHQAMHQRQYREDRGRQERYGRGADREGGRGERNYDNKRRYQRGQTKSRGTSKVAPHNYESSHIRQEGTKRTQDRGDRAPRTGNRYVDEED